MKTEALSWRGLRDRGSGLLFAIGFNGLLLLALLTLAPAIDPLRQEESNPVTFELAPAPKAAEEKAEAKKNEEKKAEEKAEERNEVERPVEPAPPVVEPEEKPPVPLPFLVLNSKQMAAADIGALPKVKAPAQGGPVASGASSGGGTVGPGEGPGGVQLFEAEWYRRPTHAELSTYVPSNAPADGWGLVACKTVENNRVENCQTLGESPLGSGLARAVRQAAWQFLVRPPRVNGKPMVGSWVRIRIDYSRRVAASGAAERQE